MRLLRKILASLRPARARYGAEVLFSGWVQVPAMPRKPIREIIRRR